ncbi:methylmalonyl-CoA mutase family protein [Nocardia camponoti]|uniref:Methylmalonyl-CoA mutase small subunit MutA n=1 Tax=Nocardia camponoti TaxID=1616106 RepID=A0A917Q845_9NOCA|nr:methylmalonyl-CoA mutase family protein [Nocardia camponoti]GGK34657.1 putative methylmalonyl-CoA mutase small subunit MutA [Nocardia camponoti]
MPIGSGGSGTQPDAGPVPEFAAWRQGVAGVLAKARRVDASTLPDEPERLLDETTYDGLTVAPLYTRRDELPEQPLPGSFPFVRGTSATRDPQRGWFVAADVVATAAAAANRTILTWLENGVSALSLTVGADGVPVADVPAALNGLLFELAPLRLVAGTDVAAAADALYSVLDGYALDDRTQIQIGLGATVLTDAFVGTGADVDLDPVVALAVSAAARSETVRAITVDGTAFHNIGAADAQELGASVAAGLIYLRALVAAGLDVPTALAQVEFRLAATDDQFATIAKFRAARRLWARVAEVLGAPDAGSAPQHAVTSAAMMTQRDPWVNLLRTTLAAFGAGVGGADSVTVAPFDSALPSDELGVSRSFADRMARNIQLLLLEESRLGHVADPAAGSWYVDSLTDELAAKAWEFLREIEAAGGLVAAHDLVTERIATTAAQRASDVAHRKTAVTGVNEFPNLGETPLSEAARGDQAGVVRYGAEFEALRNRSDAHLAATGARPKALIVALGPVAEHNARTIFTANVLASGGIESVNPGPLAIDAIAAAATDAGAPIAVLCGSDARYGDEAGAAIDALRAAGVGTVLLAGPEKSVAQYEGSQRPDGFLTLRIDAVAVLSELLEKVGA